MSHIALYRAYRPRNFQDMVGQQHITRTLQNSLKETRISHAYLFCGPRGTGKTSAAKLLARAVNCEQGPAEEPCNVCHACKGITDGSILDVVEIDAASNRGVEEIRDVRDKVKYAPTEVRYRVYIIDEVHMLTTEAFNALLKTLEEPPAHVIFILATTEPGRIPATIMSRCQRFDFRRISLEDQRKRLQYICEQEGIQAEGEALELLARLSDGGMRDALSMLDQVVSFSGDQISYADVIAATGGLESEQFAELASSLQERDIAKVLDQVAVLMTSGKSVDKCMESLIQYFRDLLLIKMVPGAHAMTGRILDPARFASLAEKYEQDALFHMIDTLNRYHVEMKYASQPQILFEIALMKLCTVNGSSDADVKRENSALEEKLVHFEQRLDRLAEELQSIANAGHPGGGASSEARRVHSTSTRVGIGGSSATVGRTGGSAGNSTAPSRPVKHNAFLKGSNSPQLKSVLMKWSQVLQRVKEKKITVHAWLVDGEPVSVVETSVLLAFKSAIHRSTTEKPANRQLIEQMMGQVYGEPYQLQTIMLNEWKALKAKEPDEEPEETLQLVSDEQDTASVALKQDWVKEAIDLFGEDLVVIKEDKNESHQNNESKG